MTLRAVCFAMMPFGRKSDAGDELIDFDAICQTIIAPAINEAGLPGIRADEEISSGFIHKLMYERLILSQFAIADLTVLNANVYYGLGIRHAARPSSTVPISAASSRLPFDVGPSRCLPCNLDDNGAPRDVARTRNAAVDRLRQSSALERLSNG